MFKEGFEILNSEFIPELSYNLAKKKLYFDLESPKDSLNKLLGWFRGQYNQARYFGDSEVIERDKVDFLLKEIRSYTSGDVIDTKLLFKYDPRTTNNFHLFIDGKENLMMVVRLANNMTIGGFSSHPLVKPSVDKMEKAQRQGHGRGFLFSCTLEKTFPMVTQPRSGVLTYDEFYFVFGNA